MHKRFLNEALEQACLGRGVCAPNPSVGAVVVHGNAILARAWHQGVGSAHAEQSVLQNLPTGLDDITLYVTLEPCNHWGKTPPCVEAIIAAGVSRVVFGFCDPNPVVITNNTPRLLREHGIEVIHFPLPAIDAFYQSYQYWTLTKKPRLTAKLAQTVDGKIAGPYGQRRQLSNELCAQFTHEQRLYTDIILTSAATIHHDDPLFTVRLGAVSKNKPIAIIDRELSLPIDAKIFSSARHCHVFHDKGIVVSQPYNHCSYHGISVNNGRVDLEEMIAVLGKLGFHDVWVEAGGRLFSALHEQGLVQRTYLYIVPMILGPDATPAYQENNFFTRQHTISWQIQANNMIACVDWQEVGCLPD